jgi:hypothetical protein
MVLVCRLSFQENCTVNGSPGEYPPTKVRKSSAGSSKCWKNDPKPEVPAYQDTYQAITPLGFGINEFLPLDITRTTGSDKKSSTLDLLNTLSEDVLGMCLFNGFLDTFETARLMVVNKRIRKTGRNRVQHLDLRRCEKLTAGHVANIATSLLNLTVSHSFLMLYAYLVAKILI